MKHFYIFIGEPVDHLSTYLYNRLSDRPYLDTNRLMCRALRSYPMMIQTNHLFYRLFLAWKQHQKIRKYVIKGFTHNPLFLHQNRYIFKRMRQKYK